MYLIFTVYFSGYILLLYPDYFSCIYSLTFNTLTILQYQYNKTAYQWPASKQCITTLDYKRIIRSNAILFQNLIVLYLVETSPGRFWKANEHYYIHKRPPSVSKPSQNNPVQTHPHNNLNIHFIFILASTPISSKLPVYLRSPDQSMYGLSSLPPFRTPCSSFLLIRSAE
jgi:hypothetical protein